MIEHQGALQSKEHSPARNCKRLFWARASGVANNHLAGNTEFRVRVKRNDEFGRSLVLPLSNRSHLRMGNRGVLR